MYCTLKEQLFVLLRFAPMTNVAERQTSLISQALTNILFSCKNHRFSRLEYSLPETAELSNQTEPTFVHLMTLTRLPVPCPVRRYGKSRAEGLLALLDR